MLASRARLRTSDVKEVLKQGKTVRSPKVSHISMRMLRDNNAFRAAVVVPKSIARTAVVRNRLRRALYRTLAETPHPSMRAIFFVQKIPPAPLATTFRSDVSILLNSIQ